MSRAGSGGLEKPWRLPGILSTVALVALLAWPHLERFPSGTPGREALAFVLALGTCGMLLGLGLGLWIAARLRSTAAVTAGVWSVLVALAWWWVVIGPLLAGGDLG